MTETLHQKWLRLADENDAAWKMTPGDKENLVYIAKAAVYRECAKDLEDVIMSMRR